MSAALLQGGLALQGGSITEILLRFAVWLLGLGIAAAGAAALVAMGYRWYVRERVPTGLGVLFGLSVVAVYLGTRGALGDVILGQEEVLESTHVLRNLTSLAVGGFGALTGTKGGDRLGTDLFAATGGRDVNADVSEIVQTVGRVTSVRLPDDIDHIVGYDAVPDATLETLAGRRFLFPRRLTKAELRDRLVTRLKTDYGVGHVDLELDDDGNVSYLAVGSRAAGIGPTLPPATNALAIHADPAHAASAGDLVQVWETDPLRRVLTGELRGVAGEVVTVAIDAADTQKLDPGEQYKLVTLPVQSRPDREFASLLRAADETMGTVHVEAGSELVGQTVGDLGVIVAAITREGTTPETLPSRGRTLSADDHVYAIATPDALRRLEAAAVGTDEPASSAETGDDDEDDEPSSAAEEEPAETDAVAIPDAESSTDSDPVDSSERRSDSPPTEGNDADDAALLGENDGNAESTTETDATEPADNAESLEAAERTDTGDEPVEVWDPDDRVGAATEETDETDEANADDSENVATDVSDDAAADETSATDSEQADGDDTERNDTDRDGT